MVIKLQAVLERKLKAEGQIGREGLLSFTKYSIKHELKACYDFDPHKVFLGNWDISPVLTIETKSRSERFLLYLHQKALFGNLYARRGNVGA